LSTVGWWITRVERTLYEDVPGPSDDVRAFFVDLDSIKLVHPLVVSVQTLSRINTADGGYVQTYRVGDRIPLGPLHLRTSYVARLDVPVTGDVSSEARQFPRVRLRGTVAFEPTETGTRVVERVQIEAPRPLAAVTTRKAVEAHIEMLAGIRRRFEGAAC
jgi:Polyketide cyclase / dehydrase and lipid transport